MSRIIPRVLFGATLFGLLVLAAAPAGAHESRTVGAYQLVLGWQHEPTYVGVQNAVQLFIKDAKGAPIDDLGSPPTLRLSVSTQGATSNPLELKPSFDPDTNLGTHGEFDAALLPTAPGTFSVHLTGAINGQKIDEVFTSSDKTFDNVRPPTAIEFPVHDPTNGELATNVSRLTPRVDAALAASKSARDKVSSAQTLSVVAIVVGVALGGGGLAVGLTKRRRSA